MLGGWLLKLFFAPLSPFVRKVLVTAHETQQDHLIERVNSAPHPIYRDEDIARHNPLGQAPTAIADDGEVIYGSRVICEYLDAQSTALKVFPVASSARWRALVQQALGDGITDAALLARYEQNVRPAELRWDMWSATQMTKVTAGLDEVERLAKTFGEAVTIGTITIACAIGYLDFRFGDLSWRSGRPAASQWYEWFAARPSMMATRPQA
ncbi:glutathione S-transferase family protein [Microvirga puerhi]|uniref:Glutathione S-transferase family protein n=1 Tax=Microvirga puerhi TaxID=2876078 RepID=A0ABS7VIX0_9HYPH|nr:glutathione S-transferase family protein [Microvirga puerhi]MBZ6075454.1 glutathione S-transferase family protein [Microvirga puerhi]